ncbi:family 16 glycosylhydrolase [Methylobacterium planeticum]|nr:family 16 glycosylhydrolase [Methylobacterium planeticum]
MSAPPNYALVFSDEFSRLSIADSRTATANWYTAQAWGGGFGDAAFMPAGSAHSPFSIVSKGGESALQIEMTRNASGQLESGLISNTFPDGTSTTVRDGNPYGYYEARMWLPEGRGIWPGFWAIEKERLSPTRDHVFEIDVLEHHGTDGADRYGSNLHDWDWNGTTLTGHSAQPKQNVVGNGVLATGWHTYGLEVKPDVMTFSMDGKAYDTKATPATLTTDLMMMVNLAAGGGWPVDPSLDQVKMYVDYVRFYEASGTPSQPQPQPQTTLTGTTGNDTFSIDATATRIIEAANGGFDTVRSSASYILPEHVEKLVLAEGLALDGTGNAGANQLYGNAKANTLSGLAGDDYLYGQGGNDTLLGGLGNDKLYGGDGADRLVGGAGADRLQGDAGADTFVLLSTADSLVSARDTIVGFSGAEGDRIDLAAIDANTRVAGDQAFTWIGAKPFTQAGQLRFDKGVLYGDVDGDHVADIAINLGTVSLLQDFLIL